MIAALFVETDGTYFGIPGVDPWDIERDARLYEGPHPVVAHPPCQRWGRYWGGAPKTWPRLKLGNDGGCFATALHAVRMWGGVLEHPEGSHAWRYFQINEPPRYGGWVKADWLGGWTCCVEQGHYGHISRKATWLYAFGFDPPPMIWGRCERKLDPELVERLGYKKASRRGTLATVGGGGNPKERNATPPKFRDALIDMARSASGEMAA